MTVFDAESEPLLQPNVVRNNSTTARKAENIFIRVRFTRVLLFAIRMRRLRSCGAMG
jgi:hypothetical protein